MNFKTTIFLLVLVLLVGAYFVFVERKAPTTQEQTEATAQTGGEAGAAAGTPLFTADKLSTEAVQAITIEADGKQVVLKKEGAAGDWTQVEPVHFPLNTWSVQSMIDAAAGLRYTRKLQPGDKDVPSLEKLDLAPPKAIVTLTTGGDKPAAFRVKVGRTTLGGRGFVMVGDDPAVYVVNDSLHKLVEDQKPDAWRRKTIQAPTESQVSRVTLTRNGQTIEVIKSDGNWAFAPPNAGRADSKAVTALLTGITGIYIDKFVADAPADLSIYGLDKPAITLTAMLPLTSPPPSTSQPASKPATASGGNPTVKTLRIGSPVDLTKESYYATWDDGEGSGGSGGPGGSAGVVFTIPKSDIEKFAKSVDDLRDPRITPLPVGDITGIDIPSRMIPLELEKGPAGWVFGQGRQRPKFPPDNNEVSNFIDSIVNAKATGYERFSPLKFGDSIATISLTAIGRIEPDVLHFYPAKKDKNGQEQWLVIRNNESTGYLLPHDKIPLFWATASSLRDREIFKLDKTGIVAVMIKQPDMTYQFERDPLPAASQPATKPAASRPVNGSRGPGPWKLVGEPRYESPALESLLDAIVSLHAKGWIDKEKTPAIQPWAPAVSITFATYDGRTHKLAIDDAKGYAQADDLPMFEIDRRVIDLATAEFRDRTVLPVAAEDFKQVTVARDGKTLTIHKDDDGNYVSGDDQKINQAAAGALFDTLANLRVQRYLEDRSISKPGLNIGIETRDGKKEELSLGAAGLSEDEIWMSGNLWKGRVRVSKDVIRKLDADLTAKEKEPVKGGNASPEAE